MKRIKQGLGLIISRVTLIELMLKGSFFFFLFWLFKGWLFMIVFGYLQVSLHFEPITNITKAQNS